MCPTRPEIRRSPRRGARTVGLDFSSGAIAAVRDLLSAVLDAGLVIELFHEFDRTPAPTPWLNRGDDGLYRFPEGLQPFPLTSSLRARLPVSP